MPYEVVMPAMEMGQQSATLLQWLRPVGAYVNEGELLMEIETDKVTVEIEAPASGILESVHAAPGDVVPVGTLIAVISAAERNSDPVPTAPPTPSAEARVPVALSGGEQAERRPLDVLQSRVAARVHESYLASPHIFLRRTVDVTPLVAAAKPRPGAAESNRTLFAYVLAACAATLVEHPVLNAHLVENELILWPDVHLGVAVSVDDGLIVPVIRQAQLKSAAELTSTVADLAARARASRLLPNEVRGSTFSVSNLGSYDIDDFTAIINAPEVGILTVGRAEPRPAVAADGRLVAAQLLTLTLGADHRAVNGAMAAAFLTALSNRLGNRTPMTAEP